MPRRNHRHTQPPLRQKRRLTLSEFPPPAAGPAGGGPVVPVVIWRCFSLLPAGLLHYFLFATLKETAGDTGTYGWFISASFYGYLIAGLLDLLLYAGVRPGAGVMGVLAAIFPLPRYLLAFPLNWPLSLAGICLCIGHGRLFLKPLEILPETNHGRKPSRFHAWSVTDECLDMLLLSCLCSVYAVIMVYGYRLGVTGNGIFVVWGIVIVATLLSLYCDLTRYRYTSRQELYAEHALFLIAAACACRPAWVDYVLPLLAVRLAVVGLRAGIMERGGAELWRYLVDRPAHLLVYSFALVILIGTVLLTLPIATRDYQGLSAINALFTATSATCVTGLSVVDIAVTLSWFGQIVLLLLIQTGGLGIMTISTFIALLLGQSIGLKGEFAIQEMVGEQRSRYALRLVRFIILATFIIEFTGALILLVGFRLRGLTWLQAAWSAVFHSVSAFCNAGFALFARNLEGFGNSPGLLLTISLLIILGGLGFSVQMAVLNRWRRREPLGLHARLVLTMTLLLCFGGAILLWLLEREGGLERFGFAESWLHAWFQSVTTRTAGFNSVDLLTLGKPAFLVMVLLMFIGAGPGSTAGGIKVTTAAVLGLVIHAVMRGRNTVTVAGRRLVPEVVMNAISLICLSLFAISLFTGILLITESQSAGRLLFEAVSAFGTVGLSLGVTPTLTTVGKLCIIALMFIGRVGALTLLIMTRPVAAGRTHFDYPTANVMIG